MRTILKTTILTCIAVCINSCGMPGSYISTQNNAAGSVQTTGTTLLNYVIGNFIGKNTAFTKNDLLGTWNYKGADCKFESENLLKQAGGEIAATSLENKLNESFAKIGFQENSCSFTFNEDGSYIADFCGHELKGTYVFDEAGSKLSMIGTLGLTKSEATLIRNGNNDISLLYDADKIMDLVITLSSLTGNATINSLTSLLSSYDGVKIGFELKKQ